MPTWLKYFTSILSGFGSGAAAMTATGNGSTKNILIGGTLGVLSALGNLSATAPKDQNIVAPPELKSSATNSN